MKYEKIGKVSSASVEKATKKTWDEWVVLLEKAGARNWTHQEIVAHLKKKYRLGPWWQQGVTLGFEIAIGRRMEGRTLRGDYSVTITRTLPVEAKILWKFLVSEKGQSIWLRPLEPIPFREKSIFECEGGVFGQIRTMKAPLRARLSWQETDWEKPSIVQLYVVPRAGAKCIFAITHEQLVEGRLRPVMRSHWKEVAERIAQNLPVKSEPKTASKRAPRARSLR